MPIVASLWWMDTWNSAADNDELQSNHWSLARHVTALGRVGKRREMVKIWSWKLSLMWVTSKHCSQWISTSLLSRTKRTTRTAKSNIVTRYTAANQRKQSHENGAPVHGIRNSLGSFSENRTDFSGKRNNGPPISHAKVVRMSCEFARGWYGRPG